MRERVKISEFLRTGKFGSIKVGDLKAEVIRKLGAPDGEILLTKPLTGIDHSALGIEQMNQIAQKEGVSLEGQVGDIYAFEEFGEFDCVLLDSMFHFAKKDKEKEIAFLRKIVSKIKDGCLLVICIQDTEKKVQTLNQAIDHEGQLKRLADKKFTYVFEEA